MTCHHIKSYLSICVVINVFVAVVQSQSVISVEDILSLKSVGSVEMSPDGQWVAFVLTSRDFDKNKNNSDIWIASTSGGEPVRITYHEGQDNSPQWMPDGSWLAFLSDRNDKTQVYGIRPGGGEAWQVTDWNQGISWFMLSPNGQRLAFVSREKKSDDLEKWEEERGRPIIWDESYHDQWSRIWLADLEDNKTINDTLFSGDGHQVTSMAWSPGGDQIAYSARPSVNLRSWRESAIYIGSGSGNIREVCNLAGGEWVADWNADHGLLIGGSGQELGTYNNQIWQVQMEDGSTTSLTKDIDEHARLIGCSPSGLFLEVTHRTANRLFFYNSENQKLDVISDDEAFYRNFSLNDDGDLVAFIRESAHQSPNIYVSSTDHFEPKQLTYINAQSQHFELGKQQVVTWKSKADGEEIEGVLTFPVGYQDGQQVPLLLVIHGGPAGVSSNRYGVRRSAYPIQVFAGMGYAILQPNYRGSTGYGERFRGLNRGDISGKDWIDIDSGVDAMIDAGIADPDQLGIMGWSFGGHHTFWGITQTDRFKAASAGAGANDLISMYSQTDIPEFYHTYLGPKPWEDFDLYEERSAYRYVNNVTTPLLIQVGEKDERVPAEQSIQFYEAVKSIGKAPTQLVLYPGQPHGVREPRLLRDLMMRNVEWFNKWLPTSKETN